MVPKEPTKFSIIGSENVVEENSGARETPEEDEAPLFLEWSICSVALLSKPQPQKLARQQSLVEKCNNAVPGGLQVIEHRKVSDHIQWFNNCL